MMRFLLNAVLLCGIFLSGCGYTTGSLLPSNFRTIYVEPFKNNIAFTSDSFRANYVPLLENRVHTAVIDRFQFDGHLHIKDSNKSDLILKGALTSFDREDLRVTDDQNVQEYRIRITVALTLVDASSGEELWHEPNFSGEATYFTTGPNAKSESAAVDDALVDLSRRVVERTIENW